MNLVELRGYDGSVNVCHGDMVKAIATMCPNLIDVTFVEEEITNGNVAIYSAQKVRNIFKGKLAKVLNRFDFSIDFYLKSFSYLN